VHDVFGCSTLISRYAVGWTVQNGETGISSANASAAFTSLASDAHDIAAVKQLAGHLLE
jgi:hypothetical protein